MSRIKQPKTFEEATGVSSIQCLFCYNFFAQDARLSGLSCIYIHQRKSGFKIFLTDLFNFLYLNWRSTHRMLNSKENYANVDEQRARAT